MLTLRKALEGATVAAVDLQGLPLVADGLVQALLTPAAAAKAAKIEAKAATRAAE